MKLLEDWQKTLSMVINHKLSMMDTSPLDIASSEAMGDYSKPNLRESSDSDSDLRGSSTDLYFDEYNFNWTQNPYKSYSHNYQARDTVISITKTYFQFFLCIIHID